MAGGERQIKLSINIEALAMIDKECRARGMSRVEFMTRASLAALGASPFTATEEDRIRDMIREEIGSAPR